MINSIQKLDDALLYGAQKAVNTWNWTTGGTKVGLANKLLSVAPIVETAGQFAFDEILGILTGSVYIIVSHYCQKFNQRQQQYEELAEKSDALDIAVETVYKPSQKRIGGHSLALAGVLTSCYALTDNIGSVFVGGGNAIRSSSHFIMRTDSPKPRKNCVSRGVDKLSEMIESYTTPQPVPIESIFSMYTR